MAMIVGSLIVNALFAQAHIAVLVVTTIAFASGFALQYAPLVNTALRNITAQKSGIAIGFYNLTINIAIPLGIAYTAKLLDATEGYTIALWVLSAVAAIGAIIYVLSDQAMAKNESKESLHV